MTAEEVFGEIGGVEGKPVGFVEAFETHGHFGGSAFSDGREVVGLDILE